MNLSDLKTLLDYHYWARDRIIEAIVPLTPDQLTKDLGNSFKSIRDTAAHLHAAEWAWHERWNGRMPAALLANDRFPDVASLEKAWREMEQQIRDLVDRNGEAGVDKVYDYKLFSGASGSSPFWQMLQHLVNHASYHRGQITTMLRQLGAPAGKPMDMIAYYRTL